MFKTAKLKLTAWYLLIIIVISIFLSFLIYRGVSTITNRALSLQKSRMERRWQNIQHLPIPKPVFEVETLTEIKKNLLYSLFRINIIIFFVSGVSGYFLAGRTLKPIEKMVEEQNRFISDAAHELKTPLTALKAELEVNLREKEKTKKDLLKILKSNLEEVNKLQRLSEALLKNSRYNKENFSPSFQNVDFKKVIDSSINSLIKSADKKGVRIKPKLQSVIVYGNKTGLEELVSILLDNAIKFSDKNSEIKISLQKDNNKAELSILDRGAGIRKSDLPHIFNRFFQADSSRTKIKNDGFGLGLSIAKKIVDLHKGTIEVKSEVSKGSTFTVRLPLY